MITKDELRHQLPKVGDIRMEVPSNPFHHDPPAEKCVVIEVHPAHLYYRVRFKATGFTECYKVPKTERLSWEG